jgi:anti-anti-sigma factor
MATPLSLDTGRRDDGAPVLRASGELDLSNLDAFTDALVAAVAAATGSETVTVDLSRVDYLDSGAINALYEHTNRIHVIVNPILMSVLKVSGLADVVAIESA